MLLSIALIVKPVFFTLKCIFSTDDMVAKVERLTFQANMLAAISFVFP